MGLRSVLADRSHLLCVATSLPVALTFLLRRAIRSQVCSPPSPGQVCPPSTKWLVVTNGDNEYSEDFFQMVSGIPLFQSDRITDV